LKGVEHDENEEVNDDSHPGGFHCELYTWVCACVRGKNASPGQGGNQVSETGSQIYLGAGALEAHPPWLCLGAGTLEETKQKQTLGQRPLEAYTKRLGLDSGTLVEMTPLSIPPARFFQTALYRRNPPVERCFFTPQADFSSRTTAWWFFQDRIATAVSSERLRITENALIIS